jgi:hypothetical protein
MHIEIQGTAFLDEAKKIGAVADQLPFIMSLSLNRAAKDTREHLVRQTWPQAIKQRNTAFIGRALRTKWSDKTHLSIEIYDDLGRASLKAHAEGGVKVPKGSNLAIPNTRQGNIQLTAHGVSRGQRPSNIKGYKALDKKGNQVIYEVRGKGKGRQIRRMYLLKPKVTIKKDVPFHEDFESEMSKNIREELPIAVIDAMRTAR